MNIVLIGYRGSGKTSIGRHLGRALSRSFVDLDDQVVAAAGMNIRDIFERHGEARFRELESSALRSALVKNDLVIAPGGGAVLRDENRNAIVDSMALVIYLYAAPHVLSKRIAADTATAAARPSLTGVATAVDEVAAVLSVREPIYRSMAHIVLDVTELSLDDAKRAVENAVVAEIRKTG